MDLTEVRRNHLRREVNELGCGGLFFLLVLIFIPYVVGIVIIVTLCGLALKLIGVL